MGGASLARIGGRRESNMPSYFVTGITLQLRVHLGVATSVQPRDLCAHRRTIMIIPRELRLSEWVCGWRPLLRKNISKDSVWLVGQLACFSRAADWPDASTLYPVAYPEVACAESYRVVMVH